MIKFAFYWVWGVVIPFTTWDEGGSTVIQAFACTREAQRGEVFQAIDCVAYGPSTTSMGACDAGLAMAKIDMPERGVRACVSVRRSDLERLNKAN
jgi:hypothetical protein